MKVFISKVLVDSNINRDESVVINNALKEYYDMKEEIKNPKTTSFFLLSYASVN